MLIVLMTPTDSHHPAASMHKDKRGALQFANLLQPLQQLQTISMYNYCYGDKMK